MLLKNIFYWVRPKFFLLLAVCSLSACESSSDSVSGGGTASVNTSSVSGASNLNIPEIYISNFDTTPTLLAARGGLDLTKRLVDTTFSCFDQRAINYEQPHNTFNVSGTTFISNLGNGAIDYLDGDGEFSLSGGGFEADETGYIRFTDHGQEFEIRSDNVRLSCYQHGASLEKAYNQFLINTPEPADYTCKGIDGDDEQLLRLSPGGTYQTASGSGFYEYSDIIDSSGADIEFIDGPLEGTSSFYSEDDLTGRQEFALRDTESTSFGIGLGASSSSVLSYTCGRYREPRPFKVYGSGATGTPRTPRVPLSGLFFVEDIRQTSQSYDAEADYYRFRSDGFLKRGTPHVLGDDCSRTAPNGLNYCETYDVVDGELLVFSRQGEIVRSPDIIIDSNNNLIEIGSEEAERITPIAATHVNGGWNNIDFFQSGCVGGSFCSSSFNERDIILDSDGRYIFSGSGSLTSSVSGSSAFGSSNANNRGYYEIRGNRLIVWYDDGDFNNFFIYFTNDGNMALSGLFYTPLTR